MAPKTVCMKTESAEAIQAALEKAKRDALEILHTGRVFDYSLLRSGISNDHDLTWVVQLLQGRHMPVVGIPEPGPNVVQTPSASQTRQPQGTAAADTGEDEASDIGSVSSGETFQCVRETTLKSTKAAMKEKGLHDRHSRDHPLLKEFHKYLRDDLQIENCTQEVDNVARYLYYFNRHEPTMDFVKDRPKLREYIQKLTETKLSKQTQLNYLKSLKRFLTYHTSTTNMVNENPTLHNLCKSFLDFISTLQKCCSRSASKEIVNKRFNDLMAAPLTPKDCLALLKAAKPDFLNIMGKLLADKNLTLETTDAAFVLYYLEAVVILRHLQRPGVVENMTVKEWITRKRDPSGDIIIAVKEHKTAAQQVAGFALSQEEEMWFDEYFTRVRPIFMQKKEEDETDGRFFISTKARPIYNASNDLYRLHKKYKVPQVTSQICRRVFETATINCSDQEKAMVAKYLSHSTATSEKHYRMHEPSALSAARRVIAKMGDDTSSGSADEGTSQGTRGADAHHVALRGAPRALDQASNIQMEIQSAYDNMLKTHPVELDAAVPSKTERCKFSPAHDRQLYERWLKAQMKLRVKHVLSHFARRQPTENRIITWIEKQGWTSNVPNGAKLFYEWKPSGNEDNAIDSRQIQKLVMSQKWRGLHVTEIEGKDNGVIATRIFQRGEVVCDYHGHIVTAQKGKEIHEATSVKETGYMFFYMDNKGKAMAIDAHSESCDCHPGQQTFGRLINHSKTAFNLRPRLFTLLKDGEQQDVILLIATKEIKVNTELLFDYGVNSKSFGGEGSGLSWLD